MMLVGWFVCIVGLGLVICLGRLRLNGFLPFVRLGILVGGLESIVGLLVGGWGSMFGGRRRLTFR